MPLLTSSREKRLWLWATAVLVAIYATLFMGRPLANQLRDQNVQAIFFVFGMVLTSVAVVIHALKTRPSKIELSVLLGILAAYVMFIFRLGAPERSHLIEYSVLAVLIHKALIERSRHVKLIFNSALLALVISFLIGVLDESVQLILPNRVFDPQDIMFNSMAVTMAIGTHMLLTWLRKRISNHS